MTDYSLRIDPEYGCEYLTLSSNPVDYTRVLEDGINIDVDADGKIIGIERIFPEVDIPYDLIQQEFHLSDLFVAEIKEIFQAA